jgi:cell division ATPase FtsA
MGFWNLNKSKNVEEITAVVSVGSSSVGAILTRLESGRIEIISSTRVPINFLFDVDFPAFWRCAQSSIQIALKHLAKDFPQGPSKIAFVFSSPWVASQHRIIKITKDKPFRIQKGDVEKIIKNEVSLLKKNGASKMPLVGKDAKIIEQFAMKVCLGDEPTQKYVGEKTSNLKIHTFISSGIESVMSGVEDIVMKNFGKIFISFHTLPLIAFSILKKKINSEKGFLLVDIGGEITDVSLVRKQELREVFSFPKGKNHEVRRTAEEFKISLEKADSMIKIFREGHLKRETAEKLSFILKDEQKKWLESLKEIFSDIREANGGDPIPSAMLITSTTEVDKEVLREIKGEGFSMFVAPGERFKPEQVKAESLEHCFRFKRGPHKDRDIFLMMESLFVNGE